MEKKEITGTSTEEMVTISLAEYEKLLGQGQQLLTQNVRISRLEKQVELLMEALRLSRQKRFGASSEKADAEAMDANCGPQRPLVRWPAATVRPGGQG